MQHAERLKRLVKPALGLGLLLLVLSQLQIEKLKSALLSAHLGWFVAALLFAVAANLLCALRWQKMVVHFGGSISTPSAIRLYFQGVAANTVFPGGIVGGDVWRAMGLIKQGMPKLSAAQSVFFDRASGFWSLSVLAVLALAIVWRNSAFNAPTGVVIFYAIAMLIIALGPVALTPVRAIHSPLIFKTALVSIASQLLTVFAFIACLSAVKVDADPFAVAALCAGIFLGAAVPASVGGFGSREVASLFLLSVLGVDPEAAFLGSVLFGLTATLQGLVSFLAWVRPGMKPS